MCWLLAGSLLDSSYVRITFMLSISMLFFSYLYKIIRCITLLRYQGDVYTIIDTIFYFCIYISMYKCVRVPYGQAPWTRSCIKWLITQSSIGHAFHRPFTTTHSRSALECLVSVIYTGIYAYNFSLMKSKLYTPSIK